MGKVTESIFSGLNFIVPLADVQHIQRCWKLNEIEKTKLNYHGLEVITKHTTWDFDSDAYANSLYIPAGEEAESFMKCWCRYRHELEMETIIKVSTDMEEMPLIS